LPISSAQRRSRFLRKAGPSCERPPKLSYQHAKLTETVTPVDEVHLVRMKDIIRRLAKPQCEIFERTRLPGKIPFAGAVKRAGRLVVRTVRTLAGPRQVEPIVAESRGDCVASARRLLDRMIRAGHGTRQMRLAPTSLARHNMSARVRDSGWAPQSPSVARQTSCGFRIRSGSDQDVRRKSRP
jgi:hypothetical protein